MNATEIQNKCAAIRKCLIKFIQSKRMDKRSYDPYEEFIAKDPLAPIIGTICDEQISADMAWHIPLDLSRWLQRQDKNFRASVIQKLGAQNLKAWLSDHMRDKWPTKMEMDNRKEWLNKISQCIIRTCEKIWRTHNDDPDTVFITNNGTLSIPLVYFILRQFDGIGPKKASMIARDFSRGSSWFNGVKVRLKAKGVDVKITQIHFTEMPIDVHVRRVFERLGFARYNQPQDFQNLARLIYPDNPGLVDDFVWNLGREVCKTYPLCEKCCLNDICPKENI